ncbi:receptor-like protein 14 [Tripterygium wilfordii]|uniref:receptor-like protein 14 n=1 Tax=Tripterygium wilfordii TaxID=458696 RepID=UPI0018F861D2|nr:receptor-like protein 14 [Tripterygium wilfordii]
MKNMEHLKCWRGAVVIILVLLNWLDWSHGCVDQEREALLQLKSTFERLNLPEGNSSDCCEWERVECNATTGRVTKLSLESTGNGNVYLNASYFLPFEQLTSLNLHDTYLDGCVENQGFEILWSRLRKLEVLDLSSNYFQDNIISSLSGFSSLKSLSLNQFNQMGATLDDSGFESLWQLRNLETLDLSGTKFNNSLLSSLRGLSSLKDLNLADNQLSGTIDMEDLSNLVNLKKLDLSKNEITGFVSFKGDLELLDLSDNYVNNSVFFSLTEMSHLKSLNLSGNQLTGSIHLKELAGLRNLEELRLDGNNIEEITGPEDRTILNKLKVLGLASLTTNGKSTLLKSLGALSTLKTIDLGGNILNETNTSRELFNLSTLEELFLDHSSLHKNFLQNHVGSSTSLKVLHLSNCGLKGTLSGRGWCELSKLQELDLGHNELEGTLPSCLANLSSLRILDLSNNRFRGNIVSSPISNLKSIEYLSIQYNHFQVSFKPFANHSSLKTFLANDGNELIDEADSQLWTPKFQLEVLILSNCILNNSNVNSLNFLHHQFELRYLDLSGANFSGAFPNWLLENNTRLETVSLANNSFFGPFRLPSHSNPNMSVIDVSQNKLQGQIPSNISSIFPNLRIINLSENSFQGTIPASFGELKSLTSLDLSDNQLSGELEVLFAKTWLSLLKLSNNYFSGHIPANFNLCRFEILQLDGNNFVGELPDLSSLGNLGVLDMSDNSLSGKLPRWVANMSHLYTIDLSDNQFNGPIPPEFCTQRFLVILDLSGNNLSGSIPSCFRELINIEHIHLRRNKLSGPMSQSFYGLPFLVTLDLGENNFSGQIPNWIGNFSELGILILRGNQFHGDIPIHLCNLNELNILDLSSNSLSGRLPPCLSNFSFISGSHLWYPFEIGEHGLFGESISFNYIRSTLKGELEFTSKGNSLNYTGYILDHMYGIDLSCNRFSGEIPPEFGNLTALRALNLSHNSLNGSIPTSFSNLKQLESLDLSYNDLKGRIPPQLTEINTLAVFSVAHNKLSGPLPDFKGQFATFSNSCYEGNPLLCGLPLSNNCDKTPPTYPLKEESEEDGFMDMTFFWITFAVTYTVALFGVAIVLFINSHWRHAWFYHIDLCFNTCYYFVVDKFH